MAWQGKKTWSTRSERPSLPQVQVTDGMIKVVPHIVKAPGVRFAFHGGSKGALQHINEALCRAVCRRALNKLTWTDKYGNVHPPWQRPPWAGSLEVNEDDVALVLRVLVRIETPEEGKPCGIIVNTHMPASSDAIDWFRIAHAICGELALLQHSSHLGRHVLPGRLGLPYTTYNKQGQEMGMARRMIFTLNGKYSQGCMLKLAIDAEHEGVWILRWRPPMDFSKDLLFVNMCATNARSEVEVLATDAALKGLVNSGVIRAYEEKPYEYQHVVLQHLGPINTRMKAQDASTPVVSKDGNKKTPFDWREMEIKELSREFQVRKQRKQEVAQGKVTAATDVDAAE